jgi:hypothetical protein
MKDSILKNAITILGSAVIAFTANGVVPAQYPSSAVEKLKGSDMQTLLGVIRIPKEFGVVPNGPGLKEAAPLPCNPFFVAVFEPGTDKLIAKTDSLLEPGRDQENFYTCKYSLSVPANTKLYAVAGMSSIWYLQKKKSPPAQYVTDAWVGGTNNKPRRGYERGFAGKFVTIGKRDVYLKFDMYYAQVDPN